MPAMSFRPQFVLSCRMKALLEIVNLGAEERDVNLAVVVRHSWVDSLNGRRRPRECASKSAARR